MNYKQQSFQYRKGNPPPKPYPLPSLIPTDKNTTHIKLFRFSKMSFNQSILQTIDSNNYVKTSAGFIFNIMQFLKSLEKFHHQAIIILIMVSLGVKIILDILVSLPVFVSQQKKIIV